MKAIDNLNLPPIRFTRLYCEMDEKEKADYDNFAKSLEGYVGGEKFKVPSDETLVAKLVQLASGTAYQKDGRAVPIHSHKVETLLEMIEESEGRPLLVAYWFKGDFERLSACFKEHRIRFADISSQQAVDDWNARKLQVGLIHPAKAGHGLNLQAGGATVVWYTMPWNYELYAQTNARLYRNGQKEAVTIVHIMTRGTIDDAIYAVLLKKQALQNKLFADMKDKGGVANEPDTAEAQRKAFYAQLQAKQEDHRYLYLSYSQNEQLPPIKAWQLLLA